MHLSDFQRDAQYAKHDHMNQLPHPWNCKIEKEENVRNLSKNSNALEGQHNSDAGSRSLLVTAVNLVAVAS